MGIERFLRSEISRVERATEEESAGLEDMERRIDKEIRAGFNERRGKFEEEEEILRRKEESLTYQSSDLENRYYKKRRELERSEEQLYRHGRDEYELRKKLQEVEGVRRELEQENSELQQQFETFAKDSEEGLRREFEREKGSIEDRISAIKERIGRLPEEFRQKEIGASTSFERNKAEFERKRDDIEEKIRDFGAFTDEEERALEREFMERRNQSAQRIRYRNTSGDTELSKRLGHLLEARRLSSSYDEEQAAYKRLKACIEFVRSRA